MNYAKLASLTLLGGAFAAMAVVGCTGDDDQTLPDGGSAGALNGGRSGASHGGASGSAHAGTTAGGTAGRPAGGAAGSDTGGVAAGGIAGGDGDAGSGGVDAAGAGGTSDGVAGAGAGGAGAGGESGAGGAGGADSPVQTCAPAFVKPTNVPDAIKVSDTAVLVAAYGAIGTQTYTCNVVAGPTTTYAWSSTSVPDATLRSIPCDVVGSHYAGPRWKSIDNSVALGSRIRGADSATASSVPQLLLSATTEGVAGIFTPVTAVQRLDTVGGIAPITGCTLATVGTTVAVPYTANYYFYSGADIIPPAP